MRAVKSNNSGWRGLGGWIMNVSGDTEGSDRRHLAAAALWLYHRGLGGGGGGGVEEGEANSDVYITEVLVSVKNVIPFTRPSRSGLTPPPKKKTTMIFFLLELTKQVNRREGWWRMGGRIDRKASLLIFCPFLTSLLVCIYMWFFLVGGGRGRKSSLHAK